MEDIKKIDEKITFTDTYGVTHTGVVIGRNFGFDQFESYIVKADKGIYNVNKYGESGYAG